MRKTFPDQFGYDACLEKDWFWKPTEWSLSTEAAKDLVGYGAPVEPFVAFHLETDYFTHHICISKTIEEESTNSGEWTLAWRVYNSERDVVQDNIFSPTSRRICERGCALLMEILANETVSEEDHLHNVQEQVEDTCDVWSKPSYRVFSGRELVWYENAIDEYQEQKLNELYEKALEEKNERECKWQSSRSQIHMEARRNRVHQNALDEWEDEKQSRQIVAEFESNSGELYEIPIVEDEDQRRQLARMYVEGDISLSEYEEKVESIIVMKDPIKATDNTNKSKFT